MKDALDFDGLLKTLFGVFFWSNWWLLALVLIIGVRIPIAALLYVFVRGFFFIWPESRAVLWAALGAVVLVAISIPLMQHYSRRGEGEIVAHVEQVVAQNRFRMRQIIQLDQVIAVGVDAYALSRDMDLEQIRIAAKRQSELATRILNNSLDQYRCHQMTERHLRERFDRAIEENQSICREMRSVRDSADRLLTAL